MRPKPIPKSILAIAGVTLLAPFAGGSYYLWGQACLVIAVGLLFLLSPPRNLPDGWLMAGSLILLLLTLTAFLPASLFPELPWRKLLADQLLVALPATRSPQPWMTFEATVLLVAAVGWGWRLFSTTFSEDDRHTVVIVFSAGIILLAGISLSAYLTGQHVPFWSSPRNFGPFPNRNQTGNLLALSGLMIEALILCDLLQRRFRALFWLLGLAVIVTGLTVNYSRAGIALFFGGSLLWLPFWFRDRVLRKTASIAVAAVILVFSGFLLFGGDTLKRFDGLTGALPQDARWTIFQDAKAITADAPLLGYGLGNFERIFAMHRSFWRQDDHLLHPESDWFWASIEWGVPATVLLAVLILAAMTKALPLDSGADGLIRSAALIGCLAFMIHGLVDVSAHRPGTLWPALLLLAVARRPTAEQRRAPWLPVAFRVLGLALCGIGACWLASYQNIRLIPTSYTAQQTNLQIEKAVAAEEHQTVERLATENLKIRPLDYWLYLRRARARLLGSNDHSGAERDFRTARLLEPAYSGVYMDEGDAWLDGNEPQRAIAAYTEAFQRSPERAPHHYGGLLNWIQPGVDGREVVRALAQTDQTLWFLFLQNADAKEAKEEIDHALVADPTLHKFSTREQSEFFSAWWRSGQKDQVAQFLIDHPDLLSTGWPHLATWYAEKQQFQAALELAWNQLPAPTFPKLPSRTLPELESDFRRNKSDIAAGYALYHAQHSSGQVDAAFETVRQLTGLEECPPYLFYIAAELWARKGDWEKAWLAWTKYQKR